MASYKQKYEKLLAQTTEGTQIGAICPTCGKELLHIPGEIYCEDKDCTFDKILFEIFWDEFKTRYGVVEH